MPKYPSKFCDHINPEGANYCGMCATDLSLPKKEVENRDTLYELFSKVFKEYRKDAEFAVSVCDSFLTDVFDRYSKDKQS